MPEALKRKDLKKCVSCNRGVMHDRSITFTLVTLERFVVRTGAVQRQAGLEMMLGSSQLAAVMGADEDMATRIGEADVVAVCDTCMLQPLAVLAEQAGRARSEREEAARLKAEQSNLTEAHDEEAIS